MADIETPDDFKKLVARNLTIARRMAGLSQEEVMTHVWHRSTNKNRISEIETGRVIPSLQILYALSRLYGVSTDYVMGLSAEPELDLTAGRVGMLYGGMKEVFIDAAQSFAGQMCALGAMHIASMPKPQAIALLSDAKMVIKAFDTAGRAKLLDDYPDLAQALFVLAHGARQMDQQLSIQMRSLEMRITDTIDRMDTSTENHLMLGDAAMDDLQQTPKVKTAQRKIGAATTDQLNLFISASNDCIADPLN